MNDGSQIGDGLGAYRFDHQGLLGTMIDIRVDAVDEGTAERADGLMVREIARLQGVFSAYDPGSELSRWKRGEKFAASVEFVDLMGRVLAWQKESGGRFNPLVGELSRIWVEAQGSGVVPGRQEMSDAAEAIATPRFEMVDGLLVSVGDCELVTLNAIAKGYIVDRAIENGGIDGVVAITVNAGGDLAHWGAGSMKVGIENPHRPYDNEPPIAVVELSNGALATSGDARQGFRVAGRFFGHVIDPLTGWPVEEIASISVVAPDAMTADVVATVAGVRPPAEAVAYLDEVEEVEGLVVDRDRSRRSTKGWEAITIA